MRSRRHPADATSDRLGDAVEKWWERSSTDDRPWLVDAFCGAGGATKGYQAAGFRVVGVDINPQPNYVGDAFIQGDAVTAIRTIGPYVAAGHGSPPCQGFSTQTADRAKHPRLIEPTRAAFIAAGIPYVIENVEGARPYLLNPVRLCGSSFDLDLRRHRYFEANWGLSGKPCDHSWQTPRFQSLDRSMVIRGRLASVVGVHGHINYPGEFPLRCAAMGIDWMTNSQLVEAIPPAYTEFLGGQLIAHLDERSGRMPPTSGPMPPPDKFLDVPTIPLFGLDEIPSLAQHADETTNKRATPPPAARADCPRCRNVSVGLDADAGHYRWRVHSTYRARGASTPCSASGQLVHDLPPRDGHLVVAKPRDGKPNRRPAACGCEVKEVA